MPGFPNIPQNLHPHTLWRVLGTGFLAIVGFRTQVLGACQ